MSKKQKSKLDKSWTEKYDGYHLGSYYANGAYDFQQKAIKDLDSFMKTVTGSSLADTCFKEGIFKAIQIIKELKA